MMKFHLKSRMAGVLALLSILTLSAGPTVRKQMPRISDEDRFFDAPGRIYYFDSENYLHCYDTKREEDTKIDDIQRWAFSMDDAWYDSASDVVFVWHYDRGTEVSSFTIYRITDTNKVTPMITLSGPNDELHWEITGDYIHLEGFVDEYAPSNIPGIMKGQHIDSFYSPAMTPWKFTRNSLETLEFPELDFYAVTAPGVNVRSYGDPKAPRIGYFKPRGGYEEEEYYRLWSEDEDVDTEIFTRTFIPWHPEKGAVFASNKDWENGDGWIRIMVDFPYMAPAVSSKFVKRIDNKPLVSTDQISDMNLKYRVHKVNSAKYPGMWLMIGDLPDCGEAPLLIGKEINGIVVFKWLAGWPLPSGETGKRIEVDESNTILYGNELYNREYGLDFSKLNDSDLDTILRNAVRPIKGETILVDVPGEGVRQLAIPAW